MDAEEQKEGQEEDGPASVSRSSRREREGGSDGLSQKKSRVSSNSAPRTLAPSPPPASGKNPLSSFPDVCLVVKGHVHRTLILRVCVFEEGRMKGGGVTATTSSTPAAQRPSRSVLDAFLFPPSSLASTCVLNKHNKKKTDEERRVMEAADKSENTRKRHRLLLYAPVLLKQRSKAP